MNNEGRHFVTGAFGFLGRHIARQLLGQGQKVATLVNAASRGDAFGGKVLAYPLDFKQPQKLVRLLRGAAVLYNTYWIRYPMGDNTFEKVVQDSSVLFAAAKEAGVPRVVHISITNPSETSPLAYFRGKAMVERALVKSGLSHAILRPAVLFGDEGILINNLAWVLRHVPVFGLFGDGLCRVRPIFVEDLATLAIEQGELLQNVVMDAVGPETFTFRALVEAVAGAIGVHRPIVSMPPRLAMTLVWGLGRTVGDNIITRQEMRGLMSGLLWTDSSPTGWTRLTDWLHQNAATLGRTYMSEKARREFRQAAVG